MTSGVCITVASTRSVDDSGLFQRRQSSSILFLFPRHIFARSRENPQVNNNEISPIFVLGAPRSGTTLTAKIIGSHPALFMPGETHFFEDIYPLREQLGQPDTQDGARKIAEKLMTLYGRYNEPKDQARLEALFSPDLLAQEICANCTDYEQVLTLFMARQMKSASKQSWGNNAPRDIFSVKEIARFYPNAKIILCVRDPRDFLGSYKGKWRATNKPEVERLQRLYHPIVTSLLWSASNKQRSVVEALFPPQNVLLSPYERLVGSPEDAIRAMCSFLGVEYSADMLDIDFSNSSGKTQSDKRIFSTSVGQWTHRLSNEEVWICQKLCGRLMQQFGYEPSAVSVNPLVLAFLFIKTPFALVAALNANKHKRGPLLPYLAKRIGVLVRGTNS